MATLYEDSLRPMNRLYRFADQFGTSRKLRNAGFIGAFMFPFIGAGLSAAGIDSGNYMQLGGLLASQAALIPSDFENIRGHERKINNGSAPASFGIAEKEDPETGEIRKVWSTTQTPLWDTYLRNGFGHAAYVGLSIAGHVAGTLTAHL